MLSGWKGSGKDTAADFLVSHFGFERRAFAGVLKDMVSEQYGVPRHFFDDRELKESALSQYPVHAKDGFSSHVNSFMAGEFKFGPKGAGTYHTPRSLCILEGSVKRSVDPNYWVKRATHGMDSTKDYVITDWRYRSEHEAVKHLAPLTIRIQRFDSAASTDPSERDLDSFKFDWIISNRGSFEDLLMSIEDLLVAETA